jgi:ABC-2 type transport system ATP-binding protein
MKQKLGLACALIHSPRLLLLDEPTNGVDPVSRRDFWKILYDLVKEGISIVVTTAYLDEAERTNRVALMHKGSIIQLGEPHALKSMVTGIMMELVCSDLHRSKEILLAAAGVLDANVFGDTLHVRIKAESDEAVMREGLQQEGIRIDSLRKIAPAMEDAFLSLIPRDDLLGDSSEAVH